MQHIQINDLLIEKYDLDDLISEICSALKDNKPNKNKSMSVSRVYCMENKCDDEVDIPYNLETDKKNDYAKFVKNLDI